METIVFYTLPSLSHLTSMVEFSKLLLAHSLSLSSITFLLPTFPTNNNALSSYSSSVSFAFPSITFRFLPHVPLSKHPSEYPDDAAILFEALRNDNASVLNALQSISTSYNVSAFILDFFCYASVEVAHSLGIPTYFFFTMNAACLALFLNFPEFDKIIKCSPRTSKMSLEIPGLFSIPANYMLEPMLDHGVSYQEFLRVGETLRLANGIIINSFYALESRAVEGLMQGICLPGTRIPPIHCVGPLVVDNGSGSEKSEQSGGAKHECVSWLDTQPRQSVVYLAFGSYGSFSKKQIRELSLGLERSRVRFLWVVRAPSSQDMAKKFLPSNEVDLGSLLPEGFLERTKERGLVVKSWAPQIAVLGHESIGGFVTHCGWNSTLEAVCAGVPMVAWPLYAEQRFNKVVLVQEIKIALPMNESEDRFVSSGEIESRLKQTVESEEGDVVRKRVSDLKDQAKAALDEGGSAKVALSMLVESWKH